MAVCTRMVLLTTQTGGIIMRLQWTLLYFAFSLYIHMFTKTVQCTTATTNSGDVSNNYSSFQYPYNGPLRKACRSSSPPTVEYIDNLLLGVDQIRHSGGHSLPQYYRDFFGAINPGVRVYMVKDQPIIYMQMRQAGADTINDNLRHISNFTHSRRHMDTFERDRSIEATLGAKSRQQLHNLLLKRSKPSDYTRLIKQAQLFTFVTDPIERFLYAVNECYLRQNLPHALEWKNHIGDHKHSTPKVNAHKQKSLQHQHFMKNHQATSDIAKEILNAILTGNTEGIAAHLLLIPAMNHFNPMSNLLREFEPHFVGDYNRLLEQWEQVEGLYGTALPLRFSPAHDKYRHLGRVDTLGLLQAMRGLLAQEPQYMKALCKLYLRDYVCFGIPLPAACHDDSSSGASMAYVVGRRSFTPPLREY